VREIPVSQLAISASDLRQRIARGASIRYLVPEPVIDYIQKHRLYREEL
jgi:nicotinate-nucleotide adenylyltransferase